MSLPKDFRILYTAPASRWRFRFRFVKGRPPREIPRHMPDSHAGRRWPEARAHRLHGVEGPRQRARPAPHLSLAGKRSAPGRISDPAQDSRQAGFRFLGRLRAELRGPADSLRTRQLDSRLGARPFGKPVHPDLCDFARRSRICPRPRSRARCEPARYSIAGTKRRCASLRAAWKKTGRLAIPPARPRMPCWAGMPEIACGASPRPIPIP